MVMGGVNLVTVKEILGHSSIEMTMRYSHPTPENKRKAVDVLAAIFNQKSVEMERISPYREDELESGEKLASISKNN